MKYSCLSLGEGASSENPPDFLVDELFTAVKEGFNQYTRTFGNMVLTEQVAQVYGKKLGRDIDPERQIIVGPGGSNVLVNALLAYVNPGEEVVVFEPAWSCYIDMVQLAGGVYRPSPLDLGSDGKWHFNADKFQETLSLKTKVVILNNAHNPTGKLFSLQELEAITQILDAYPQIVVISDDVYEFLDYDQPMVPFASLKSNFDRTLTCHDAGKLFNCTGWTVAWALGPEALVRPVGIIHNTAVYSVNTPAQVAIGRCLGRIHEPMYGEGKKLSYLEKTKRQFVEVRELVTKELSENQSLLPLKPLVCESGFFITADISGCLELIPQKYKETHDYEEVDDGKVLKNIIFMKDGSIPRDLAFCRWMAVERGVIMMPVSLFYHPQSPYRCDLYVRIAICKGIEFSAKAIKRLIFGR